jgi:hypothetical protein
MTIGSDGVYEFEAFGRLLEHGVAAPLDVAVAARGAP